MTTNPLTQARQHVADLLAGVGVPVHTTPPEAPTWPCVVITCGWPWLTTPHLLNGDATVHLVVRVMVGQTGRTETNLARAEELVWACWQAVSGLLDDSSGVIPPTSTDLGTGGALVAEIPISLIVGED